MAWGGLGSLRTLGKDEIEFLNKDKKAFLPEGTEHCLGISIKKDSSLQNTKTNSGYQRGWIYDKNTDIWQEPGQEENQNSKGKGIAMATSSSYLRLLHVIFILPSADQPLTTPHLLIHLATHPLCARHCSRCCIKPLILRNLLSRVGRWHLVNYIAYQEVSGMKKSELWREMQMSCSFK